MDLGPTTALAGALEGLLVVDRAGVITYANPAAEKILGLPATEIVHSTAQAWKTAALDGRPFPVDDLPVVRLLRTGESTRRAEHALQRADGTQSILSHTATLIRGDAGEVEGVVVSLVDVTDEKQTVERAKTAELGVRQAAELESIHASMGDGVVVCDAGGRITLVNDASVGLTGVSRADAMNRTLEEYGALVALTQVDGTPLPARDLPIARALGGEKVTSAPLCSVHTGKKAYLETNATPLRNEAGPSSAPWPSTATSPRWSSST